MEKATFGAGCFWGVQAAFDKLKGVLQTKVGFMGGFIENPSYEKVCTNTTGHVEVVQIKYDSDIISYEDLLETFFNIHDPTQKNGQGPDIGTQYRSVIFYYNENQKKIAEQTIINLNASKQFEKEIVTDVIAASTFYQAEEYHQKYYRKNKSFSCRFY
jgi:peptide-methionine (S)-S-oxide reductase